jgi:hypothetical protein
MLRVIVFTLFPSLALAADEPELARIPPAAQLSINAIGSVDCLVHLDGQTLGYTPLYRVAASPGIHEVAIDCVSGSRVAEKVELPAGRHTRLVAHGFALSTITGGDPSLAALAVSVPSESDCRVQLDDALLGFAPLYDVPLTPGDHAVEVRCENGQRKQTLSLHPGITTVLVLRPPQHRMLLAETHELPVRNVPPGIIVTPSGPAPLHEPSGPARE